MSITDVIYRTDIVQLLANMPDGELEWLYATIIDERYLRYGKNRLSLRQEPACYDRSDAITPADYSQTLPNPFMDISNYR